MNLQVGGDRHGSEHLQTMADASSEGDDTTVFLQTETSLHVGRDSSEVDETVWLQLHSNVHVGKNRGRKGKQRRHSTRDGAVPAVGVVESAGDITDDLHMVDATVLLQLNSSLQVGMPVASRRVTGAHSASGLHSSVRGRQAQRI